MCESLRSPRRRKGPHGQRAEHALARLAKGHETPVGAQPHNETEPHLQESRIGQRVAPADEPQVCGNERRSAERHHGTENTPCPWAADAIPDSSILRLSAGAGSHLAGRPPEPTKCVHTESAPTPMAVALHIPPRRAYLARAPGRCWSGSRVSPRWPTFPRPQ